LNEFSATPKRAGNGRQSLRRFGDGPALGGLPRIDPWNNHDIEKYQDCDRDL
jgi:hypothetical protein